MIVQHTPPMGWNSWNTFGENINEKMIFETADVMAESGLRDKGYEYLVIDDCWSLRERDENGRLVPDPEKFPHGMKAVADYVHSKGLKFGMYSCAGNMTCAGYPGSYEHEFVDAETFASWDVDFLKYDYCYHSPILHGKYLYRRMGLALENCGRDILFSACSWGADETHEWIKETGASMWRSTGDIFDTWDSVKDLVAQQEKLHPYNGVGCFNDMDMLIVGMHGKGNVGLAGCSDVQYQTHYALWAFLGSPLMIGCDIRRMTPATKEILTNKDVIAINQDIECRGPYCIKQWNNPDNVFSLVKPLANGDYAIGMFNFGDRAGEMSLQFWDIGLPAASGRGLSVYDCWKHEELGTFTERFVTTVEPHGCAVLRAKVVKV